MAQDRNIVNMAQDKSHQDKSHQDKSHQDKNYINHDDNSTNQTNYNRNIHVKKIELTQKI